MGKYEDEIETEMMKKLAVREAQLSVSNVIKEIEGTSKANEFQKIVQQTLQAANTKPKKDKWFNIFKSK